MLASHILSKGLKAQLPLSFHWVNATIRLKSGQASSSDSSSDSDNDTRTKPPKWRTYAKTPQANTKSNTQVNAQGDMSELNTMVERMEKRYSYKQINVAVRPQKNRSFKGDTAGMSYIQQLSQAAANVAQNMRGDRTKIQVELLEKAKAQRRYRPVEGESVLQQLAAESRKKASEKEKIIATQSVLRDLQKAHYSRAKEQRWKSSGQFDAAMNIKDASLFGTIAAPTKEVPALNTWKMLESRWLKLKETQAPRNVFQELIQWTEEGKLWKFPIDNEQGMEKEHSVHFSEHVFMERHLKGWCPRKGPIRHFMELVCVGLSKNPYMTVEEKVEHIMWYKQYFGEKQDLLMEIGAIEEPMLKPTEKLEA